MLVLCLQYSGWLKLPNIFASKFSYIALLFYVEADGLSDHEEIREDPNDHQCTEDSVEISPTQRENRRLEKISGKLTFQFPFKFLLH